MKKILLTLTLLMAFVQNMFAQQKETEEDREYFDLARYFERDDFFHFAVYDGRDQIIFYDRFEFHDVLGQIPFKIPVRMSAKIIGSPGRLLVINSDTPFEIYGAKGTKLVISLDRYIFEGQYISGSKENYPILQFGLFNNKNESQLGALGYGHVQAVFDHLMASVYEQEIAAGAETTRDGRSQYKSTTDRSTLFVNFKDFEIPDEQIKPGHDWYSFSGGVEKVDACNYLISSADKCWLVTFDHDRKTYEASEAPKKDLLKEE